TLDYVAREMTSPEGGFYSASDADSAGGEGAYFVWTGAEIDAAIGEQEGRLVRAFFDVTPEGDFDHGRSVLWRPRPPAEVAARAQGRLRHELSEGRATGEAFLDDYAFLIAGLLDLFEVDPDPRWPRQAIALQERLDADFADAAAGGYFFTAAEHEALLTRPKPDADGALPAGNSVAALNLL